MERDLKELVASMTLEEKAGMCSGADFWNTKAVVLTEFGSRKGKQTTLD